MKLSLFSSWNVSCGIADYSAHLKNAIEQTGAEVCIIPALPSNHPFDHVKKGLAMNKGEMALIQHEYALFTVSPPHSFFRTSLINALCFLFVIRIPVVITMHELMPEQSLKHYRFRILHRLLFSLVHKIIVHTDQQKDLLYTVGIHPHKIIHIPHPIPPAALKNCIQVDTKIPESALAGRHVLTIFGFISERKGYEDVISSMEYLHDCCLLIAGGKHPNDTSDYVSRLERTITSSAASARIIMLGYVPDSRIPDIMSITDVILAPYKHMAGSGALSIAVAYAKPIIGRNIEPMRELKAAGAGIDLFEDQADLTRKIQHVLSNKDLYQRQAKLSAQYAKVHSYDVMARQTLALYSTR